MPEGRPLEDRLQEVLRAVADRAPAGAALVAEARARAARRRRARVGTGGVALVLVSLPVVLALTAGDEPRELADPQDPRPSRTALVTDDVPTGWHVERWRHVRVRVPNTWGEGHLSTWCWRGSVPGSPVVERPTGRRPPTLCEAPRLGYGVQFVDTDRLGHPLRDGLTRYQRRGRDARFPAASWVGVTCGSCEVAVRVVSPDEYVARYLLRTVVSTRGRAGSGSE